jgi:hypothetical protein
VCIEKLEENEVEKHHFIMQKNAKEENVVVKEE